MEGNNFSRDLIPLSDQIIIIFIIFTLIPLNTVGIAIFIPCHLKSHIEYWIVVKTTSAIPKIPTK